MPSAELAVIGGSGFYELLDGAETVSVETPWGPPSSPITVGQVGDVSVAFVARHGAGHTIPPHRIPVRANLWALRELGVRRVVGPCAVGSLKPELAPGHFVILDQLVDRTWGRPGTFVEGDTVEHVSFADPYCPDLGARLLAAATPRRELTVHQGGTVVVINGPRFSTRAEAAWHQLAGWDVVNMTQAPEAYLARELGLCYAGLALVTDYDTGVAGSAAAPVTMADVLAVLADNVERTRQLLFAALPTLSGAPTCSCATSGAASLRRRP